MQNTVFQRYEKKYILTREQYTALMKHFQSRLHPDQYGNYSISNIYYDTDNFDLIRMSIEKPVYKEKLRLRSYGTLKADELVFLELKKKYDGVVYKRREKLLYDDAKLFLSDRTYCADQTQIMKEIGYFLQIYPVKPKVFICYERVALTGFEDERLRVTFDTGIRFRQTELSLSKGNWGTDILKPDQILMEIKVPNAFPMWLSTILSAQGGFPVSFSKYGTCYSMHMINNVIANGGFCIA